MPGIFGWYPVCREPGGPWPPVDPRCIGDIAHPPKGEAPPDFGPDQAWRWGRLDIMFPEYAQTQSYYPKED